MTAKMASSTILSLNDDCLYLILSKFSVQELIIIEKVCPAFQRVALMVYRTHKVLDFQKITDSHGYPLRPLQAREVAQRVGPYVHTLKASRRSFSMTGRVVPKSVLMYCKNLQKIFLYDLEMTDKECLKRLSDAFVRIREVHLVDSSFTDEIGDCLRNSSQLEVIRFVGNIDITGQCLIGLQGIKELTVSHCNKLQPQFFIQFCLSNLQLRRLSICGCQQTDSTSLSVIATKLIYLESLEFDDDFQASPEVHLALANLPYLKSMKKMFYNDYNPENAQGFLPELSMKAHSRLEELEVRYTIAFTARELDALKRFTKLRMLSVEGATTMVDGMLFSLSCKDTLEELNITRCRDVTPQGLIKFVRQCSRLRKLNISMCDQYTIDFLVQLASHLDQKLEIWAGMSYFSSIECDQDELKELLWAFEDKIKLHRIYRVYE